MAGGSAISSWAGRIVPSHRCHHRCPATLFGQGASDWPRGPFALTLRAGLRWENQILCQSRVASHDVV
jgi:hypothetical protein